MIIQICFSKYVNFYIQEDADKKKVFIGGSERLAIITKYFMNVASRACEHFLSSAWAYMGMYTHTTKASLTEN